MDGHAAPHGAEAIRRRDDEELLGFVQPAPDGTGWLALTVFGARLGAAPDPVGARAIVERDGLTALGQRWFHRSAADGRWRVVVLTETWPGRARGVIGLYPMPGSPPFEIAAEDLAAGDEMTLDPPHDADLTDFALPR